MYITLAQAQTLLGRILDVYKDEAGTVDTDHLQLVIDEAEGMINAALGSRYTIPPTAANSLTFLRALVVPILRYKTYAQFADLTEIPEGIQLEYKMAGLTLDKLARQVISLPDQSEKTTGRASHIKIKTDTSTSGF